MRNGHFAALCIVLLLQAATPAEAQTNWNARVSYQPFAIYNDGTSKSILRVIAKGTAISHVSVRLRSPAGITFTASGYETPTDAFSLFDDGTHGDETRNDRVFTLADIKTQSSLGSHDFQRVHAELTLDSARVDVYYPTFFVVRPETSSVDLIDSTAMASDFVVNFFGPSLTGPAPTKDIQSIIKRFYSVFPDVYDFILLYREKVQDWSGAYLAVKNDVRGIGLDLFDHHADYGSAGHLQGILSFGTDDEQLTAELNSTVMHEFGHKWGAYLWNSALPLSDGAHWYNNSTIVGMMNCCCYPFVYVGEGRFRHYCSFGFDRFAPIELYTMGACSKRELDSSGGVYVLIDPNIGQESNDQIPCDSIVSPAAFVKITSDSIVKIYGEREPAFLFSQKQFKTATIVVSERRLAYEEICVWNRFLRHYSAPYDVSDPYQTHWEGIPSFANYTGGRLSNDFRIGSPQSVEQRNYGIPPTFFLSQNYPNPFNPRTTIGYRQQAIGNSRVRLAVYDVLGREVAVLVNEHKVPGGYEVEWDATGVASGVYFYRMQSGDFVQTRKMLVLR